MIIKSNFTSPNFSIRTDRIRFVIIHYTEMTFRDALSKLCDKNSQVSAHYLIKESGEVFQLVQDKNIAWHAGKSSWKGQEQLNRNSIGIELDNLGNTEFRIDQMNSCVELCQNLAAKYDIPQENFIGHSDIAPDRKIDPGIFFDWKFLADRGIGYWHRINTLPEYRILHKFGDTGQDIANIQNKLRKLGYKIDQTEIFDQKMNFVVRAFQSKYCPEIINGVGLKYYNDFASQYSWDSYSDAILNDL